MATRGSSFVRKRGVQTPRAVAKRRTTAARARASERRVVIRAHATPLPALIGFALVGPSPRTATASGSGPRGRGGLRRALRIPAATLAGQWRRRAARARVPPDRRPGRPHTGAAGPGGPGRDPRAVP